MNGSLRSATAFVAVTLGLAGAAPAQPARAEERPAVTVTDIAAPGVTFNSAEMINERGEVIAAIQEDPSYRVLNALWRRGAVTRIRPEGGRGVVVAITDRGEAVGATFERGSGGVSFQPFSWRRGHYTRLPTGGAEGMVLDANNRGQIVGSILPPGADGPVPVMWDDGALVELDNLPPGSNIRGINERGQIILTVNGTATIREPDGRLTVLGTLGGAWSDPVDINDRGEVIGNGPTAEGSSHAFLWRRGRLIDLGTLPGGEGSWAVDINERGHVVFGSRSPGWPNGVLWRDGEITDLGPGSPVAMNDHDQVVGNRSGGAVLWQGGGTIDLAELTPNGRPSEAFDINNRGQIVGAAGWETTEFGSKIGGRAVLWTAPPRGTAAG